MFPCPFDAAFLGLPAEDDGVDEVDCVRATAAFFAGGGASSSENDSQPGS